MTFRSPKPTSAHLKHGEADEEAKGGRNGQSVGHALDMAQSGKIGDDRDVEFERY